MTIKRWLILIAALILILAHGFWPHVFVVDYVTILIFVIIILIVATPFLAQYMKRVKVGGTEIEFRDKIQGWFDTSESLLKEKKQEATKSKEEGLMQRLEEEIARREKLKNKYVSQVAEGTTPRMPAEDVEVCGTYTVVGRNPPAAIRNYFGKLDVRKNGEVYEATWEIAEGKQKLNGIGMLVGTIFSVAFKDISRPNQEFEGVVVYEIITPEIMRGHWAGFDSTVLGFEECRRNKVGLKSGTY